MKCIPSPQHTQDLQGWLTNYDSTEVVVFTPVVKFTPSQFKDVSDSGTWTEYNNQLKWAELTLGIQFACAKVSEPLNKTWDYSIKNILVLLHVDWCYVCKRMEEYFQVSYMKKSKQCINYCLGNTDACQFKSCKNAYFIKSLYFSRCFFSVNIMIVLHFREINATHFVRFDIDSIHCVGNTDASQFIFCNI